MRGMTLQESENVAPGILCRRLHISLLIWIHECMAGVLINMKLRLDAETVQLGFHLAKLLGVLWRADWQPESEGPPDSEGDLSISGYATRIGADFVVAGRHFREVYLVDAYYRERGEKWRKVFSAHLADPVFAKKWGLDRWGGRCSILSWHRGAWEDLLCSQPDPPRSFAHVQTAGLSRAKR